MNNKYNCTIDGINCYLKVHLLEFIQYDTFECFIIVSVFKRDLEKLLKKGVVPYWSSKYNKFILKIRVTKKTFVEINRKPIDILNAQISNVEVNDEVYIKELVLKRYQRVTSNCRLFAKRVSFNIPQNKNKKRSY